MTKSKILEILRGQDEFISGEAISQSLNLSRAAVHQGIAALRQEGYLIDAKPNLGYKLNYTPDLVGLKELAAFLPQERLKNIQVLDEVTSTNTYLNKLAYEGENSVKVVLAEQQTQGKGRQGRRFITERGKGVYLSYLFQPETKPEDTAMVTAWVAVAAARVLDRLYNMKIEIKWVNDLIYRERKIGGILTEMAIEGESGRIQHIVIGIGLNVKQEKNDFPPDLQEKAGSLEMFSENKVPRAQLAGALIEELDKLVSEWPKANEEYLKFYQDRCLNVGKDLLVIKSQEQIAAKAIGLDSNFGLLVRYVDGSKEILRSGEVQVRGLRGYII